jgi:hypothetical protein
VFDDNGDITLDTSHLRKADYVAARDYLRHSAPPDTGAGKSEPPATLTYTNYRGETAVRSIVPRSVRYGSTEWHPEPQWLLLAHDTEKNADREFALKDFGMPPHGGADAGVGEALNDLSAFIDVVTSGNFYQDYDGSIELLGKANDAFKIVEAALSHQPAPVEQDCEVCGGDCASANPPVAYCPVKEQRAPKPAPVAANASAEARREIMDIYSKPGTKVRFTGEGGYEHQNAYAKSFLNVGKTYTVAETEVGDWHTDVTLEEYPGLQFNSVLFEALSQHPHASDCDKQGER